MALGQLGGHDAVQGGVDGRLVEVHEAEADLGGHRRHQVLLAYEPLGQQELGKGKVLGRLALEQVLEHVTGQDLAVDEKLPEPARRSLHVGCIGRHGVQHEHYAAASAGSPHGTWRAGGPASARQATTRRISSIDVVPARTWARPTWRRVSMPWATATFLMSSECPRSTIRRSTSSVTSMTSWMAKRPR